jgi:heme exporter protein D
LLFVVTGGLNCLSCFESMNKESRIMATTSVMTVGTEDLTSVRSRVCWGAIIAGTVVALGVQFVLTLLGAAIGFGILGNTQTDQIGVPALVWVIVSAAISLFAGGFVAAQATAGENKREAGLYGMLVWSAMFATVLCLTVSGVRIGFNALLGTAAIGTNVAEVANRNTQGDWEAAARQSGIDPTLINDFKAKVNTATTNARAATEDPAARARLEADARKASDTTSKAAWLALAATLVSMIAAIAGGMYGSGPTFRLFSTRTYGSGYRSTDATHLDHPVGTHNRMNDPAVRS